MKEENNEELAQEIKKEFQVERMILFSDAVFAIVITLMAIEIHLPETEHRMTPDQLSSALFHLVPVIFSYVISFVFIGIIWFQHLKIFSLLRSYDTGLVVRNLILLFFIGLFPFCASVMTKVKGDIAFFMYFAIVVCCIFSQFLLYHYIVNQRPQLRFDIDITAHVEEVRKRKLSLIAFCCSIIPITITYILIEDPAMKGLSSLWMLLFPIVYKFMTRKK